MVSGGGSNNTIARISSPGRNPDSRRTSATGSSPARERASTVLDFPISGAIVRAMLTTTQLQIAGMNGVHAVRAIETALAMVDGITLMEVRVGSATIEHDGRATSEALREAIGIAGFEVTDHREEKRGLRVLPNWNSWHP